MTLSAESGESIDIPSLEDNASETPLLIVVSARGGKQRGLSCWSFERDVDRSNMAVSESSGRSVSWVKVKDSTRLAFAVWLFTLFVCQSPRTEAYRVETGPLFPRGLNKQAVDDNSQVTPSLHLIQSCKRQSPSVVNYYILSS